MVYALMNNKVCTQLCFPSVNILIQFTRALDQIIIPRQIINNNIFSFFSVLFHFHFFIIIKLSHLYYIYRNNTQRMDDETGRDVIENVR